MSANENRNRRPEESSKIPYISLGVLILVIAGLLYVGYEYIADDAADVDELLNTPADTTGRELQPIIADDLPTNAPDNIETAEDNVASDSKTTANNKDEAKKKVAEKTSATVQKPATQKAPPVDVGGVEITHTVQAGETFYGIANRYNLNKSTLKSLNPSIQDETKDVKSGVTKIKVRVQAVHTVGAGDILRVVAQKYGITVQQLMAANKKTKNFAERGEQLIIPFPEKK